MKTKTFAAGLILALSMISTVASAAQLPEGSFKGNTGFLNNLTDGDHMSLIVQNANTKNSSYVLLGDYVAWPVSGIIHRKASIVNWVKRMYAFKAESAGPLFFGLRRLKIQADGSLGVANDELNSSLLLKSPGTLEGAILTLVDPKTKKRETINFSGRRGNSTWEEYVAGNFFGSSDASGGDYPKKTVNTVLDKNGIFSIKNYKGVTGKFQMEQIGPKMFNFTSIDARNKNAQYMESKIGVFVDIVNWKNFGIEKFTTEELLVINPDNASDLGFYYERH